MNLTNKRLLLYSNCTITVGINRSLLSDLQKSKYFLIPNSFSKILKDLSRENIQTVINKYKQDEKKIIKEYISFIINNDLGVLIESKMSKYFSNINFEYDNYAAITNSIIDLDNFNGNYIKDILLQLSDLNCQSVQLRFTKALLPNEIIKLKRLISEINIPNFQIVASNLNDETYVIWANFLKNDSLLTNLFLFNVQNLNIANLNSGNTFFKTSSNPTFSEKSCGVIDSTYFTVNYEHFSESQNHNTCLNRKISIDTLGNIKNCPSMLNSYGNIARNKLKEVLENKEFLKYWNISKTQVQICSICEFRNICTDCRAFLQNPNDIYSKPLKCGYDPKKVIWEEWDSNPLNAKAIDFYELKKR
jgi:SPASM domain peptide maturase of grasp-with-spasm system